MTRESSLREDFERLSKICFREVEYLESQNCKGPHFCHVARNLLASMCKPEFLEEEGFPKNLLKNYISAVRMLGGYLALIRKFPEFKKSEFSLDDGHFPDISNLPARDYVSQAAIRLRGC